MPAHPDRVRRNYVTITIENKKSLVDYDEAFYVRITTAEIASCVSRRQAAQLFAQKIYDRILKGES